MKKFKKILVAFVTVLSVLVLASCQDDKKPTVEFLKAHINLSLGDVVELEDQALLKVENAELKDIHFVSNNQNVVFISPNNQIRTVGGGLATVTATIKDSVSKITVNVQVPSVPFAKVSEIDFNAQNAEVSFNPPFVLVSGKEIVANEFKVTILKDNLPYVNYEKVSNTKYKFLEGGTYRILVSARAPGYAFSEEVSKTFSVFETPTEFVFQKGAENLHRVSWKAVGGATLYELKVNQELYRTSTTNYELNLSKPGIYNLSVKAIKNQQEQSVYTNAIEVTKLSLPVLKLENGLLKVNLSEQQKIKHFELVVKAYQNENQKQTFTSTTGQFDLSVLLAGNYVAEVVSVAKEDGFVISSEISESLSFEKLSAPSITFDTETKQVLLSGALQTTKLFVMDTLTNQIETFDFNDGRFDFDKPFGEFKLWAQNIATEPSAINSDLSQDLFVKVLGFTKEVKHNAKEVEGQIKSFVSFQKVLGATGYLVKIDGQVHSAEFFEEINGRISFVLTQNTDLIFEQPKEYEIEVVATDVTYENMLIYGTQENNKTKIIRLDAIETVNITLPVESQPITWQAVVGAVGYDFKLYKNFVLESEGVLTAPSFDVEALRFGNYKLVVYTKGNSQEYLTSLNFRQVDFSKQEKLAKPVVVYNRNTQSLEVSPVENANAYRVFYEGNLLSTLTNELTYQISSLILQEKEHIFEIEAINNLDNFEEGGNLKPSEKTTVNIVKLESVKQVIFENENVFKYDDNLILSAQNSDKYTIETKINNQIVNLADVDITQFDNFVLTVAKIANQTLINPYYITSESFTIEFVRLSTPTNLQFTNWVLTWDNVLNADQYEITFEKDTFKKVVSSNESNFDLSEVDFKNQLENGFDFSVRAIATQVYKQNLQEQLLSSKQSEKTAVKVLEMPEIISVDKLANNSYKVQWTVVENASYVVEYSNENLTLQDNQLDILLNQENMETVLTLKAVSPNYITSQVYEFNFVRLANIQQIEVFENETFKVLYSLINNATLIVNNEQTQVDETINIGNQDLFENGVYTHFVQALAEFIEEKIYYIDSEVSIFMFERHNKVEDLTVEENFIVWKENSFAEQYELMLENSNNQTLSLVLDAKDSIGNYVNRISLTDARLLEFISDASLVYTAQIKVKVFGFELEVGSVGKISSEWGEQENISKLESPTNLSVSAFDLLDKEQKLLTISWEEVVGASYYEVFVNGQNLFKNQTLTSLQSDYFTFENSIKQNSNPTGQFEVYVVAYGANLIQSEPSQVLEFSRLDKVKGFKTTDDKGGLQWSASTLSENFVFYLKNQSGFDSEFVDLEKVVTYSYANLLELEEFKDGRLFLNLLVYGNGQTTFSSEYETIETIRLDAPIFEISGDKIVIEESLIFEQADFLLIIYFKQSGQQELVELEKVTISNREYIFPTIWRYKDGAEIVGEGTYVFEIVTVSAGYITSVKQVQEKTKLDIATIEGIRKIDDITLLGETSFELVLNVGNISKTPTGENPDLEIEFVIKNSLDNSVYTFVDTTAKNRQGQIAYNIEEMFMAMKGNFEVVVKVSAVGFIDSSTAIITGTRLEQNNSLKAKSGVLTWTRSLSASATGYSLKVTYGSENNEGTLIKKIDALTTVSDNLEGISGAITANVKVVSNMALNTLVKNNIVLDSFYMGEIRTLEDAILVFEEEAYVANKLEKLDELTVKNGMFYFKINSLQADYILIALDGEFAGVEYKLTPELLEADYIYALSTMFYQGQYKLAKDKVYSFSIKALAVTSNGLDSDVAQTIKVKTQETVSNLNVAWKEYETGETNRYDTVVISWSPAVGVSNAKYLYSINGFSQTEGLFNIVDTNEFVIRSNNALNAQNHNFRIRVLGTSQENAEGHFVLTSEYSSSIVLTGLARPQVSLKEGVVTWNHVPYAEGYYIYYMRRTTTEVITPVPFSQGKTWFSEFITTNSWKVPENFSDSNSLRAYYIAVVAINRDISRKYLPSAYGTVFIITSDEDGNEIPNAFSPLIVLKSPDLFGNKDGVLMWYDMDYYYDIKIFPEPGVELKQGESPFVYPASIEALFEMKVTVKITDTEGRELTKVFKAVELFYADIFDDSLFKQFAPQFGFDLEMKYGLGHIDEFINETFPALKAGRNFISAMQLGNDLDLITSKYNVGKEYYIPQQLNPIISNYVLSWNEIVLPGNKPYQKINGKYIVIAEDDTGKRIELARTNNLSVNLIDFVNNDILKPGNQKLYVIVAGDGDYYLNGIAGTPVTTFVLPSVSANLNRGMIYWDSMQNTSGYLVKALSGGEDNNFVQNMTVNTWDFDQLKALDAIGNPIEYRLTIQATGNGRTIISGKETDFGIVIKLPTPNVSIIKGVFEWQDILNNFGYMVNIKGETNVTFALGTGIVEYESAYRGYNSYNFRTIGETTSVIGETTTNYVISSYMSQELDAVILQSVNGASTHNGRIIWQSMTDYSGATINEYKLSFDQINFKPSVFLTNNDFELETIDGATYIVYELLEGYGAGKYKVYLQAYADKTIEKDGKTYSYLLGAIDQNASTTTFEKLQTIENIRVIDGVIYWDNPNTYVGSYKLTLIQGSQRFEFITNVNSFDATALTTEELQRYDLVLAEMPVDVVIQALGNDTNLINSDEVVVNNFTKLKTLAITDFDYIAEEQQESGFLIRWYVSNPEIGVSNYEFVISYINNIQSGVVRVLSSKESDLIVISYDNDKKLHYAEIDSSHLLDQSSSTLEYRVAVVPVTNSNFISSSFSAVRSVSPPESLSGQFLFDTASQKISWAYEREGSDVIFRIIDELVTLNENNEITVVKTNVYFSQEKQFISKEIGLHRIKIAVVLGSGKVSSSYVYFYNQTPMSGIINNSAFVAESTSETQRFSLINFNLYQAGEGSSENPYIISTDVHFNNVKYRAQKPSYLEGENNFVFVQANDLTSVTVTEGINAFEGKYDGQGFKLNYHYISSKNTNSIDIGLFDSILEQGQVKNLVIEAKITLNHFVNINSVRLTAIAITNNGLVENVLINKFELVNNISNSQVKYTYGAVALQNNGTIRKVISKASITFVGGQGHTSMTSADITIGGLVDNNTGQIVDSGSEANFTVTARRVTVAGVAVASQTGATLTRVYNSGSIKVVINSNNSADTYIAGLVGRNLGKIVSSYNSADKIELDLMNTSNRVYVGGIAGMIAGAEGSLINNSFTLTQTITVTRGGTSTVDIGIMIGRTTAQDNQTQIRSYYNTITGLSILNGTITSFKYQAIANLNSLLSDLNAVSADTFELVNQKIVHTWQQDFELI